MSTVLWLSINKTGWGPLLSKNTRFSFNHVSITMQFWGNESDKGQPWALPCPSGAFRQLTWTKQPCKQSLVVEDFVAALKNCLSHPDSIKDQNIVDNCMIVVDFYEGFCCHWTFYVTQWWPQLISKPYCCSVTVSCELSFDAWPRCRKGMTKIAFWNNLLPSTGALVFRQADRWWKPPSDGICFKAISSAQRRG